jgi:hypothetical protein
MRAGKESDQGGHSGPNEDKLIEGTKSVKPIEVPIDQGITEPVERVHLGTKHGQEQ